MSRILRRLPAILALMTLPVVPATAQSGLMADLVKDITEVEQKLVALAKAMPEASYSWSPAEGVRSVGGVFQHVAADNYLLPALLGVEPPATTMIKASDYSTVQKYETRKVDRAVIIADLEASFAHLKQAMQGSPDAKLGEKVTFFGQEQTIQQVWVLTATHLHEHLGQAIAYARSNGVVPPWSRGG